MSYRPLGTGILLLATFLAGCASGAKRNTHDPSLLDDKVLQQRVDAALKRDGEDFQDVHAQAAGGTVQLTGSVASPALRARAERIASKVYGVKGVKDDVEVKGLGAGR